MKKSREENNEKIQKMLWLSVVSVGLLPHASYGAKTGTGDNDGVPMPLPGPTVVLDPSHHSLERLEAQFPDGVHVNILFSKPRGGGTEAVLDKKGLQEGHLIQAVNVLVSQLNPSAALQLNYFMLSGLQAGEGVQPAARKLVPPVSTVKREEPFSSVEQFTSGQLPVAGARHMNSSDADDDEKGSEDGMGHPAPTTALNE